MGVDAAALVANGLITMQAGRPCEAADEILLDAALAEGLGKRIGDEVILFARRSIRRMTVVGIAESQSLKWFTEGGGVVADVLHSANLGLDFVTGLTGAMAFFLVGHAMLMNVTERRRSFALLRVLGATGRQVR